MIRRGRLRRRFIAALAATAAIGCGSKYELAPVTGTVTIDDRPYPGGKVIFSPAAQGDEKIAGRPSFGVTDDDGAFVLSCYRENDGAVVGDHTITLFRSPSHDEARPDLKSLTFSRVNVSRGRVTVSPGKNEVDLELTSDEIRRRSNRL